MLNAMTQPPTSDQLDWWNAIYFPCLALVCLAYLLLIWLTGILDSYRGWSPFFLLTLVTTIAPPIYSIVLFLYPRCVVPLDYPMFYIPVLAWYPFAMLVSAMTWRLSQGRRTIGPYGMDKSFTNFIVETMLVSTV